MIHYFTFDGVSSRNFGIYISGLKSYKSPERDITRVEVPGRNGDLLYDNKRFKNISIPYECHIEDDVDRNLMAIQEFLASHTGYHRLEDTLHPEYYRMARITGTFEASTNTYKQYARFTLTFDCKPQKFLKTGEETQIYTAKSFSIYNPTMFPSKPLIRVYGTGALGVGSETVTITAADTYTDLDCELMDAFKGTANKNSNITLSSGSFPTLRPGTTGVTLASTISKVEITPRWETI